MNTNQAKETLSFYRPGTADARDPAFAEALELVRQDRAQAHQEEHHEPELARWFDGHCAQYSSLRARLQTIAVPPGLKEQILAERKVVPVSFARKRPLAPWLAIAAAVALLACVLPFALGGHRASEFIACRNQMVRVALSPYYPMDLETTNADRARAFLAGRNAPANFVLPKRLQEGRLVGCAVEHWNDSTVSMICFRSGRPLRPGDSADLWLFVVDASAVPGAPGTVPDYAPVSRATAAAWTQGQRAYILVGSGDKAFVEQYL